MDQDVTHPAGPKCHPSIRLHKVTSTDWLSHPELPPAGANESSIRPVAAATANAVFDVTGVRLPAPAPQRLKLLLP
jgi:CO/xanthine dehydrogenase Mo-binding subunit